MVYRLKRFLPGKRLVSLLTAGLFFAMSGLPAWAAAVNVNIDLSSQTMTVHAQGHSWHWRVSTARRGYHTPTGTYRPQRMSRMWYSKKYHHSPMPYSIFFLGGYAIHGTYSISHLGRPASHGCVRLHPDNARLLFSLVKSAGGYGNTLIHIQR
jgi:lipoprotein-anchoring transpeptidase ErfK/SrfK